MSSSQTATDGSADEDQLNDILTRFRPLDVSEINWSKLQLGRMKWTVSSIAEHYLRSQFSTHSGLQGPLRKISSLAAMSAAKINAVLSTSNDLRADVITVSQNLNSTTLRQLLTDERTPYKILRAFLDPSMQLSLPDWAASVTRSQDVDEAVLRQDSYIRSLSSEHQKDGGFLLSLEDLAKVLGTQPGSTHSTMTIERKDPPFGGFELFDQKREQFLDIFADHKSYSEAFHRVTDNILRGLDWNNVMVAGGMAAATLMHVDDSRDDAIIGDFIIDIYLYGLDAEAANKKVEEIYQLWDGNLPASNSEGTVVKNARSLTFFANHPYPRIRILLKHHFSPTDVLLGFDLDQCAIGFDGNHVLLLPRCARAIETSYSVLTMAVIRPGEHRRAYLIGRLCTWANRGFGIRILPAYAKSLEEDSCTVDFGKLLDTDVEGSLTPGSDLRSLPLPREKYDSCESYRMPNGVEPGLKTLKRVAYLGQDYTNRYCYHAKQSDLTLDALMQLDDNAYPRDLPDGMPDGRIGLSPFEVLTRVAQAWRLKTTSQIDFEDPWPSSSFKDSDDFDDTPAYSLVTELQPSTIELSLQRTNNDLFMNLKTAISIKLGVPYQNTGYGGYLTRRIRRHVYGADLISVMDKQITLPLIVPSVLESFLLNEIPRLCPDLHSPFLIPVHDPAKYAPPMVPNPVLAHLTEQTSEAGNLRYWVITNESMWKGQHPIMEEVFTILWSLFRLFQKSHHRATCEGAEATWHLARSLRRRCLLSKASAAAFLKPETQKPSRRTKGWLDAREAFHFREWVLTVPYTTGRQDDDPDEFEEDGYVYPVPEDLFWEAGDEGDWEGKEVPVWRKRDDAAGGKKRKLGDVDGDGEGAVGAEVA